MSLILHKSDSLLNLAVTKELPYNKTVKGLFIRFTAQCQAGQNIALSDLGQLRVNKKGMDIVNAPVSFFNTMNNIHWGAVEATNIGVNAAAVAASVYVPFHAPWDNQNGLLVREQDRPFFDLRYPNMTLTKIVSGTVEVYYVLARSSAAYDALWIQQNIQAGGAGNVKDRIQQPNISSLYFDYNANTSNLQVNVDGHERATSTQAALTAASNLFNKVETAITAYQVDLNPDQILGNAVNRDVEINLTAGAALTQACYYFALSFNGGVPVNVPPVIKYPVAQETT